MKKIFNLAFSLIIFTFVFSSVAYATLAEEPPITSVTNVTLSETSLMLNPSETKKLELIFDEGFDSSSLDIRYLSSDPSIATVTDGGTINAINVGQVDIFCYVEQIVLNCKVTIVPHTVTEFSLSNTSLPMVIYSKAKLSITGVVPSQAASYMKVNWHSSNSKVATIDANGNINAVSVGTTKITATIDDIESYCTVTVSGIPLTSFTLNKGSCAMSAGAYFSFKVISYSPSNTTSLKTATWKSSNTAVATIDKYGKAKGIKPGNTIISCTIAGKTKSLTLTINPIPLTSFTLNKGSCSMYKGAVFTFKVISYYPSNTTSLKTATWKSSNKAVATTDKYGKVKALRSGKTLISCTIAGKTKSLTLTVKEVPIKSFRVNVAEKSIEKGKSYTLAAISRSPANTTEKTVNWRSSNTSVATVSSTGIVNAKSLGYATITCTIGKIQRQCKITVKGNPRDNRFVIYLSPSNQSDVIYNSSRRTTEKAECEAQARSLKAMLAPYNVDCFIATKQFDQRPQEAKALGANLFFSIHTNAYNRSTYVYGPVCFYNGLGMSRIISDAMVRNLNKIAPLGTNRYSPSKYNSGYYEMHKPRSYNIPSILLEIDFHDNPLVAPWLIKNKTKISTYMVKSLVDIYGIRKTK